MRSRDDPRARADRSGLRQAARYEVRQGDRPPEAVFNRDRVVELHAQGMSTRSICQELGLSKGTVSRTLKEAA
jgi:DNA-binding NarL/FixJ family response regulator